LKRFIFLSLSILLLMILIAGCAAPKTPPAVATPPVIGTFSNDPITISAGGTSTLSWVVDGATSVSIDQGIGKVDVQGTKVVSPVTSTVYTLTATNSAGTVTRSAVATVNPAPPAAAMPFAVTSVIANTTPANFTGACPKTFTFYATITANGPGTVTYRWESYNGENSENSDPQTLTFTEAGTKTTTLQWDLIGTSSGLHRVRILSPYDAASNPVYYELNCGTGKMVTGVMVGVDQYPVIGPCPKTIHFWGTIIANGPGTVTYRWERSDGTAVPGSVVFTAAGTQTVTNLLTQGEGYGWQLLHILTPDDGVSSKIDYALRCDTQSK